MEEEDSFLKQNIYQIKTIKNPNYTKQRCLISLYTSLVQGVL